MAAGAGPVDPFGPRDLAPPLWRLRAQERAARREVGHEARIVRVLAAAAVARFAADPDLDEARRREIAAHRAHAGAQQRPARVGAAAIGARGLAQARELALERLRQRRLVGYRER